MNRTDLIDAARAAGIPVIETSDTPGGVKFGEASLYDLVRFAQIIANSRLHDSCQDQHENTCVATVSDLTEYGPLLTWNRHWSRVPSGTQLYTAPVKALTQEQIDRITFEHKLIWHGRGYHPFRKFARAIEAAHGIHEL